MLIEKTVKVEDFDSGDDDTDNSFMLAIPVMSRPVAIFCAVCNVISPGLGEVHVTSSTACCILRSLTDILYLFFRVFEWLKLRFVSSRSKTDELEGWHPDQ